MDFETRMEICALWKDYKANKEMLHKSRVSILSKQYYLTELRDLYTQCKKEPNSHILNMRIRSLCNEMDETRNELEELYDAMHIFTASSEFYEEILDQPGVIYNDERILFTNI